MRKTYTPKFFRDICEGSRKSARAIVPLLLELVEPRSVVDVGCGTGEWLATFKELSIDDICGIDGDYVDRNLLQIPPETFFARDLAKPFSFDRVFDLVVSLEVAEHLPAGSADAFIESLTELGRVIFFSAAVPHQGGTQHVNEQWPDYWARRFEAKGYQAIDCIRQKVWNNDGVEWWYAQNSILYAAPEVIERLPRLKKEFESRSEHTLSLVHPRHYMLCADFEAMPLRTHLAALPRVFKRAIKWRVMRLLGKESDPRAR